MRIILVCIVGINRTIGHWVGDHSRHHGVVHSGPLSVLWSLAGLTVETAFIRAGQNAVEIHAASLVVQVLLLCGWRWRNLEGGNLNR